ncbi:MAG: ABC transporter ATP-binding protein [Microbacteriaceae bacterium]|nr:ABC transporter ATP-binding protein [Microbacteriaceae bacterium]
MSRKTSTSSVPALELRNLNVWFGAREHKGKFETHTIRDVNLAVMPGERIGLVGESGCGKTTTILAAMGLLPASADVAGEVLLNGTEIISKGEAGMNPYRWKDIAMVFQGAMSAFNPVKTVGWQISEALEVHRITSGIQTRQRVEELLEMVGLSPEVADQFPHQLSGGMKQRAVIAMALSCNPKVLLADEPTTALDVVVQNQILQLLVQLSIDLNLALVLVTHDLGVVAQSCTRAAVMLNGEIVEDGPIGQLYRSPRHEYTKSLFEATPNIADVMARQTEKKTRKPSLLEVRNLTVRYDRSPGSLSRSDSRPAAVDSISFNLAAGELVALVGQSGCGKTTTVQAIMGMIDVTAGSILVNGSETVGISNRKRRPLRRTMQMIYQDPYEALDVRFTVRDTIEEPLLIHKVGESRAKRQEMIEASLEEVGLTPASRYLNRYPHELSGGQRQRVAIAASIVLRPAILLADEPVSMLDVTLRSGVLDLLDDLRHSHEMGILMITHDLSTAAEHADLIIVMRDGKIVEDGAPKSIIESPKSEYTKLLLESVPSPDPSVKRKA